MAQTRWTSNHGITAVSKSSLSSSTLSHGQIAYADGEVRAGTGDGRFVERPASPPVNKALSTWKELTAPRKVERSGIPAGV